MHLSISIWTEGILTMRGRMRLEISLLTQFLQDCVWLTTRIAISHEQTITNAIFTRQEMYRMSLQLIFLLLSIERSSQSKPESLRRKSSEKECPHVNFERTYLHKHICKYCFSWRDIERFALVVRPHKPTNKLQQSRQHVISLEKPRDD